MDTSLQSPPLSVAGAKTVLMQTMATQQCQIFAFDLFTIICNLATEDHQSHKYAS